MSKIKLNASSGGSVALKPPTQTASSADVELTLPVNDGDAGHILKTNGSGALSFAAAGGSNRTVLEQFCSIADGSTHVLNQGSITMQNVTAVQNLTTTWADATGSVVNYLPPTGTVQVIYEYCFYFKNVDATAINFFAMSVDDVATVNSLVQQNTTGDHIWMNFISVIHIGSTYTSGAAAGQYTAWGSSTKKLSMKARDYSTSYDGRLHEATNMPNASWYTSGFSSGTGGSGTNPYIKPVVRITAIGALA